MTETRRDNGEQHVTPAGGHNLDVPAVKLDGSRGQPHLTHCPQVHHWITGDLGSDLQVYRVSIGLRVEYRFRHQVRVVLWFRH